MAYFPSGLIWLDRLTNILNAVDHRVIGLPYDNPIAVSATSILINDNPNFDLLNSIHDQTVYNSQLSEKS